MRTSLTLRYARRLTWVAAGLTALCSVLPTHAKSVYMVFDNKSIEPPAVHVYDVNEGGVVSWETGQYFQLFGNRPSSIALDSDAGILFVSYRGSGKVRLINAETLESDVVIDVAGASSLAAVAYDPSKQRLYGVEQGGSQLHVLDWSARWQQLTPVAGSPFTLDGVAATDVDVDPFQGLAYVVGGDPVVRAYHTSDWSLARLITLSRPALHLALDTKDQILYTGAAFLGDHYLVQYDLTSNQERSTLIDASVGARGLTVDREWQWVYFSSGALIGGETGMMAYDRDLQRRMKWVTGRWPIDLVVAGPSGGFNPLSVSHRIVDGTGIVDGKHVAGPGDVVTYETRFSNPNKGLTVTEVSAVHSLPFELELIAAEPIDGALGVYDAGTHHYTVQAAALAPGETRAYRLICRVATTVAPDLLLRHEVTVSSNELPVISRQADLTTRLAFDPLAIRKTIIDGATEVNDVFFAEAGADVVYELTIDNSQNPWPVTGVSGMDELPQALSFVGVIGANDANAVYHADTHSLTYSFGRLDSGAKQRLVYKMHVPDETAADTFAINRATVQSEQTPLQRADLGLVVTPSLRPLAVRLSLLGSLPLEVQPGQELIYDLQVTNANSPTPVADVRVVATFADGLEFVSATPETGTLGAQEYAWRFSQLDPGQSVHAVLVLRVGSGAPGGASLETTVRATAADGAAGQASHVVRTPLRPIRQVVTAVTSIGQVTLPGEVGSVLAGEVYHYRILLGNPDNAATVHNVVVLDSLSPLVEVVDTDPNGAYDRTSHVALVTVGPLAPGAETAIDLTVRARGDLPIGTPISNRVLIQSDEFGAFEATVDMQVREKAIEALESEVVYNPAHATNQIMVTAILPPEILLGQVDRNRPFTLSPGSVRPAQGTIIGGVDGRVKIRAFFDPQKVRVAAGHSGRVTVTLEGWLVTGRRFHAQGDVVFPW